MTFYPSKETVQRLNELKKLIGGKVTNCTLVQGAVKPPIELDARGTTYHGLRITMPDGTVHDVLFPPACKILTVPAENILSENIILEPAEK